MLTKHALLLALGFQLPVFAEQLPDYENYTETSQQYDLTRYPIGSSVILEALSQLDIDLDKLTLLDAGCGTGNYSAALVSSIGHLECVDQNEGMLQQASKKLESDIANGKVRMHRARLQELPLADRSVDAIMINQVMHHLDHPNANDFPQHLAVLKEFRRVLKPSGKLIINTTTHDQLDAGYWYYSLIEEAKEDLKKRYPSESALKQLAQQAGFTIAGKEVPTDATLQGEEYFRGDGPLSKVWRDGDSAWSLVDATHLNAVKEHVRQLSATGELETYVREHDQLRSTVGQTSFFVLSPVGT